MCVYRTDWTLFVQTRAQCLYLTLIWVWFRTSKWSQCFKEGNYPGQAKRLSRSVQYLCVTPIQQDREHLRTNDRKPDRDSSWKRAEDDTWETVCGESGNLAQEAPCQSVDVFDLKLIIMDIVMETSSKLQFKFELRWQDMWLLAEIHLKGWFSCLFRQSRCPYILLSVWQTCGT